MVDEDDMDAEMEKRIFDMKDIDKMQNFVDNQVLTGIKLNNDKTKSKKIHTDKKDQESKSNLKHIESKISQFEKAMKKEDVDYDKNLKNDSDYEEDYINDDVDTFTDKTVIINRYHLIQKKLKDKDNQLEILRSQLNNIKDKQNNRFSKKKSGFKFKNRKA